MYSFLFSDPPSTNKVLVPLAEMSKLSIPYSTVEIAVELNVTQVTIISPGLTVNKNIKYVNKKLYNYVRVKDALVQVAEIRFVHNNLI